MDLLFKKLKVEAISCSMADSFRRLGDHLEDDQSEVRLDFFFLSRGSDGAEGGTTRGRIGERTITVIGSTLTNVTPS